MKSIFAILSLSSLAYAHIELGVYSGKRLTGEACNFEVTSIVYKDNVRHSLQERVSITAEGINFVLNKPVVIDAVSASVTAAKFSFSGATGIPNGAWGVVVELGQTEDQHGPATITVVKDDYKVAANKKVFVCTELVHQ